ncbi:MAG: glycosyltransferase family 1 protein [Parachlamydiaceae bacterium]|nr:glycosyltransferase family 1 protein [Parachlamydiaceae bacterium]
MQNLKRICLISNYNLYESKRHFSTKFGEAFKRKGIEVLHIDAQEAPLNAEVLLSISRFNPNLTCSFNTLQPISPDTFLWDYLEIPHLSILVDPAIYSLNLLKSPYSVISCVDAEDVELIKSQKFENCFFFPHAIESELIGSGKDQKIYDVVFIGSCYDYESLRNHWKSLYSAEIDQVIINASEMVLSDKSISIAQALCKAWNPKDPSTQEISFSELFYFIDRYTRGIDRVQLIKSIKDARVHIFGDASEDDLATYMGWKHYLQGCNNITLHPAVSYGESLEILKQSKIALNSMPFFKRGSHERVFNALACGAMPLTTETVYWTEAFTPGQDLVYYQSRKWNEANDLINYYLANESVRKNIVGKGALRVSEKHTWDQRVELLQTTNLFLG